MRCGTEFAAGRGEVLFDLSFGVLLAAKLDSQHPRIHRTSSYNDRIFARHIQPAPPNNYTPLPILNIHCDNHRPNYYPDTHLRASPTDNPHSEVSTPPHTSRSLARLAPCARAR